MKATKAGYPICMDTIKDLLIRRDSSEPEEIRIIKTYVQKRYRSKVSVTMQTRQIVIGVDSAALAGTLRMQLHELQKLCHTDKRLIIRIG